MHFNGIRSYILEDEFKIVILNNKINIANYYEMGHFDSNKIIVRYTNDKCLIINGSDMCVSKLKKNEVLVEGTFYNIEFR